jgi:hypothetical protein
LWISLQRPARELARGGRITKRRGDRGGMEEDRRATCRLRRDHPEMENGKPRDKYLSAFGDTKHLFFPPGAA